MSRSHVVFSASEDYILAAGQELRSAFAGARIERLAPEVGCLERDDLDITNVAAVCQDRPVVFVRHLMHEIGRVPMVGRNDLPDLIGSTIFAQPDFDLALSPISLQVWASGHLPHDLRADEVRSHVAASLAQAGAEITRAGQEWVLSICLTPSDAIVGFNRRADALVDWPGGRVRLARQSAQVSRTEFKLEELLKVFDMALPAGGTALDLGASPGGWTRILRRHGLTVWAIDPGDLHPSVAADPGVHHVRTTAGPFLARTDNHFHLVLNDMRMTPALSCALMLDASKRLTSSGLVILTLKITPHEPLRTVRASLQTLQRDYEILHARQLYHNRNEVTVVARRRHAC